MSIVNQNAPNALEDATNHGHSALSRYRKHGGKRDLEHYIAEFERPLNTCPPNYPCRAAAQSNLATAQFILCRVDDTNASWEIPLGLYHNALAARPVGHADRPSTLIQLAAAYLARFEEQGDGFDGAQVETSLHEATELSSYDSHELQAVSFMLQLYAGHRVGPDDGSGESPVDSDSSSRLTDEDPWNSSVPLLKRFERYGDLADLERAIGLLQKLVRSVSHIGEPSDLEHAIPTLRDANNLSHRGHPDRPSCLNNLGISFITCFERLGELSDLEHAMLALREAVDLTPHGHPDKLSCLNNLGICLITRTPLTSPLMSTLMSDLEHAISTHRAAIDLTPHGHPNNPTRTTLHAILTHREAVDLIPHGHPEKPSMLNNLGLSFVTRFERLGELSDLEDAISLYSHSASVPIGPINVRFRASQNWISCTRRIHHPPLLHAYSIAINLLHELAWIDLSLTHRYAELNRGADVVHEAAAAALDSEFLELAVEWLEKGRSIVWGELPSASRLL
ncbi:hypothetical protein L210DRAFT_3651244 [Boletus edulis BED1]|uniref:TPR-like protein n=1 Tax=Boletus edulis BED1 TaxID=1328754 RepID=A0AAD4BID7_BOLED|nr:hypothetical protein L210DRAFT_3651244 [Boletus edulis BED1]